MALVISSYKRNGQSQLLLSLSPTVAQPSKSLKVIDAVTYAINLGAPTFSNRSPNGGEEITDLKIGHYKTKTPAPSLVAGHWPLLFRRQIGCP
jgi:hypothetical protein